MASITDNAVQSFITLQPGMYLIRLMRKKDGEGLREVRVSKDKQNNEGAVTFFSGLGVSKQTLRSPGQCLVVRVTEASAHLTIDYLIDHPDALDYFTVKIDRIDDSGRLPDAEGKQHGSLTTTADCGGQVASSVLPITISGQIESVGEVTVHQGEWLSNPESNQAIEGLVLSWPEKPSGIELFVAVQVGVIGMLPEVGINEYAGLNGLGLPITGISVQLAGPQAEHYVLDIEAAFGGWGIVSSGLCRKAKLAGPTETEPLVALKLGVRRSDLDLFQSENVALHVRAVKGVPQV